jgi:hypothetical protein
MSEATPIVLRCDPWVPVVLRIVGMSVFGPFLVYLVVTSNSWHLTNVLMLAFGLLVTVVAVLTGIHFFGSSLVIDRAADRVTLTPVSGLRPTRRLRVLALSSIAAVTLVAEEQSGEFVTPLRVELRLLAGENVVISTAAFFMLGMVGHARKLAAAIGCAADTDEVG